MAYRILNFCSQQFTRASQLFKWPSSSPESQVFDNYDFNLNMIQQFIIFCLSVLNKRKQAQPILRKLHHPTSILELKMRFDDQLIG